MHVLVDGVSSQRLGDRSVALQRLAQSGAFLATSEMVGAGCWVLGGWSCKGGGCWALDAALPCAGPLDARRRVPCSWAGPASPPPCQVMFQMMVNTAHPAFKAVSAICKEERPEQLPAH